MPHEGAQRVQTRKATNRHEAYQRLVEGHIGLAVDAGFCRARIEDHQLSGDRITLQGSEVANFGLCSYMGLALDDRIKRGAIDAIHRYGSVYSSSAVYTSVGLFDDLEQRLRRIFDAPVAIAATTTLAHLAILPMVVTPDDRIIIDVQTHATVHMAVEILKAQGHEPVLVPHNDMEALEKAVERAEADARRVWYLADGVYSMYGDVAPVAEIAAMQARHESMWVYYDDAHGLGWQGDKGRGHVLGHIPLNDRMIVAASMSKGFGAGGAVVVMPDEDLVHRLQMTGTTFAFSGPMYPAEIGAAVAAADIFLSPENDTRQARMRSQIELIRRLLAEHQLPAMSLATSPIWFIRLGSPDSVIELSRRLHEDGFYVNPSAFPAVPVRFSGVRFTNTLYHSDEQIIGLIESLARHAPSLVVNRSRTVKLPG